MEVELLLVELFAGGKAELVVTEDLSGVAQPVQEALTDTVDPVAQALELLHGQLGPLRVRLELVTHRCHPPRSRRAASRPCGPGAVWSRGRRPPSPTRTTGPSR